MKPKFLLVGVDRAAFLKSVRLEPAQVIEVEAAAGLRPEELVWVVGPGAAEDFADVAPAEGKSVLWVPLGQSQPADGPWQGVVARVLSEADDQDVRFLERTAECEGVFDWIDRVENLPVEWFEKLAGSPLELELRQLPLGFYREHLEECAACREEVYDRLQMRAEARWQRLCPSIEALGQWLESGSDEKREVHFSHCRMCRETLARQARMWAGAGLISQAQMRSKLAVVERPLWFRAALQWATDVVARVPSPNALAKWLVEQMVAPAGASLSPSVAFGSRAGSRGGQPTWQEKLDQEKFITLIGEPVRLWLAVVVTEAGVVLKARPGLTDEVPPFGVEFRKGQQAILMVDSKDGTVELTGEHFVAAQKEGADSLAIVKREGNTGEVPNA